VNRRTIRGRLIRIVECEGGKDKPIQCLVFHLSPFGMLLSRSAFDFVMRTSPSAAIGRRLEENADELLLLEIGACTLKYLSRFFSTNNTSFSCVCGQSWYHDAIRLWPSAFRKTA
jgi:hypothetical protein